MYASPLAINEIKRIEGYHTRLPNGDCTTYYDSVNVLTIGFGCTKNIKPGDIWTAQQAHAGLLEELTGVETDILNTPYASAMTQGIFDALVVFGYNLGSAGFNTTGLNFDSMYRLLRHPELWGDRKAVELVFTKYINAAPYTQSVNKPHPKIAGLITRRLAEIDIWFTG